MGLLDALFSNDSGGGLLGGLPQSWQWQNPADANSNKDFLAALQQDPSMGNNLVAPQSPFGAVPNFQQAPQSVFSGGAAPLQAGFNPALLTPQQPSAQSATAPVQPSAALGPSPAPQMAVPAPQNNPINTMSVGGYQMPQFGSAADYTPTTTPANAQPAQGQLPQQASQQPLPPALQERGLLSRIGSPDGLIARLTGNDTRSISQQNLAAQYQTLRQTLIENGDTPQKAASKAMLAVMNPDVAKTVLPELFTNKEQFKTIKDGFGGEHPAFVNERDQTINGQTIDQYNKSGAGQGSQQTFDAIAKARDAGATPAQLYQMAPPQLRDGVQAMIEGRALPTNLSARGDARNQAIMLAHTIDPTFDESQIGSRVQGNKDFYGGGKSAETMRKTNQSALHFGELVDKMQTLPGTSVPAFNAVANVVNTHLLGKGEQGNFVVNGHALADELSSMFKGAGISDAEIRAWESNLSPDMSAEQQRGMAKTLLGLYRDSVSALEKKRQESIGSVVSAQKGPILGPEAEAALNKVQDFANGKQTAPAIPRAAVEAEMRRRGLMK